ncbi:hypothetical protein J7444_08340 [Labrenzia sp. R4_1]|uniref:hypothetical protein n=1 Tax=Labrenzia sp. R4_1 TaxID=2821106 RepID=UPI001ADABCEB|nr:hypothetical protein [Labrenzia sp. R4_1]MBO9424727.1 hypothetical protein [Labrenzia sp. R4_1]
MKDTIMRYLFVAIAILFFPKIGWAYGDCEKYISYDSLQASSKTSAKMSYINSISKQSYEQNADGIKSSITIPIEGIKVGGEGSWSKFVSKREALNTLLEWNYSFEESKQVSHRHVSSESWSAVLQCLKNKSGLFISPVQMVDNTLQLKVLYMMPEGAKDEITLDWSIVNGSVENPVTSIKRGNEAVLKITRVAGKNISIVVSGGGLVSNDIYIRQPPEIKPLPAWTVWTGYTVPPAGAHQFAPHYGHTVGQNLPTTVRCPNQSKIRAIHGPAKLDEEFFGEMIFSFEHVRNISGIHHWNIFANGDQLTPKKGASDWNAGSISISCR